MTGEVAKVGDYTTKQATNTRSVWSEKDNAKIHTVFSTTVDGKEYVSQITAYSDMDGDGTFDNKIVEKLDIEGYVLERTYTKSDKGGNLPANPDQVNTYRTTENGYIAKIRVNGHSNSILEVYEKNQTGRSLCSGEDINKNGILEKSEISRQQEEELDANGNVQLYKYDYNGDGKYEIVENMPSYTRINVWGNKPGILKMYDINPEKL